MKPGRLVLIAGLVGILGVIGCGDDETSGTGATGGGTGATGGSGATGGAGATGGTGGSIGEGCVDADTICADCPAGTATDDCRQDVGICNQFDPADRCQACIDATDPACNGAGGSGGSGGTGGSTGEGCVDADAVCEGCAEGPPLNDCRADVGLCNQFEPASRCQACIDQTNPECE